MEYVWNTCEFSSDIISADFSKAKFAVELHEFLDGTADRSYQNPQLFFDNTFPTDQMKLLVRDTLMRLDRGAGQPVTVIDTGFGGGKTHSLLLLHHILSNRNIGLKFIQDHKIGIDINSIPQARIVEIDCRKITKNTLWGEVAYRLDRYKDFEEEDTQRKPPMDITKIKHLFGDEPVLIMLDELPQHLFKADSIWVGKKTLGELTISFVMELISAVASSSKTCLILTLTEKQNLYESYTEAIHSGINKKMSDFRIDELVEKLTEAISRQVHVMTPVNPNQLYDVINARLVRHVDPAQKDAVIQEYANYYDKYGIDAGDILEKMKKSYPFHPSLIDILYSRIATISKFNQTRGMLRLLARVIRQIVEEKSPCNIIGNGEVRFDNAEIRDELTVRLDLNLGTVMDTDCVVHARKLDREKNVTITVPTAATIMLFSLHGHTKKSGIKRGDIKVAVGRPGIDPSLIDLALKDILDNFWYIHDIGGQEFYFDEFPNIVAIIHEHKKSVTPSEISTEIRNTLTNLLPKKRFQPIIWNHNDIIDSTQLKLFVVKHDVELSDEEICRIIERHGDKIRTNKNTIAVVRAAHEYVRTLTFDAKTLVAIKKAEKDERIKIGRRFEKDIKEKESEAAAQLASDCHNAYSHVLYPDGPNIRQREIQFGDSKGTTITETVEELLTNQYKLVDEISPDGLEIGDAPIHAQQLYDSFATDMSKPFIANMASVGRAIMDGLKNHQFGYCIDIIEKDNKYVAEYATEFEWKGYLINNSIMTLPDEPDSDLVTPPPQQTYHPNHRLVSIIPYSFTSSKKFTGL